MRTPKARDAFEHHEMIHAPVQNARQPELLQFGTLEAYGARLKLNACSDVDDAGQRQAFK